MNNRSSKFKNTDLSRLLTAKELQEYLHIGKNKAYNLMKHNDVPTVCIGGRVYVVADKLQKYIDSHTI